MENMTEDELKAILGSDYDTLIAEALRSKNDAASADASPGRAMGQLPNGHVYFDPGYAAEKYANRVRNSKRETAAQGNLDTALADQAKGRATAAHALMPAPSVAATAAPRSVDSTIPSSAPPAPAVPTPPLANAMTKTPDQLNAAGVPLDVQALLAKLRAGG